VKPGEVAVAVFCVVPGLSGTDPTGRPPLAHPELLVSGPQTKKLTLPVGPPPVALPATKAVSVLEVVSVPVVLFG
jgi:hypothetical protein